MENRPARRPRPRLSFGDMFSMTQGSAERHKANNQEHSAIRKAIPYLIVLVIALLLIDVLRSSKGKVYGSASELLAMEWQGRVMKKYFRDNNPQRPVIVLRQANQNDMVIDFGQESTEVWHKIDVRDSLLKTSASLSVRIKNYARDTTLAMEFKKIP